MLNGDRLGPDGTNPPARSGWPGHPSSCDYPIQAHFNIDLRLIGYLD